MSSAEECLIPMPRPAGLRRGLGGTRTPIAQGQGFGSRERWIAPNSANQAVLRTAASRLAQQQMACQRRLAPVADQRVKQRMRPISCKILRSRWRWTCAGLLGTGLSFFLVPFNLTGFGACEMWLMWLLFPFGMWLRLCSMPAPFEIIVWLGPPVIYGLILSAVAGTKWWRLGVFSVMALHTIAVVFAALS